MIQLECGEQAAGKETEQVTWKAPAAKLTAVCSVVRGVTRGL